jgi:drug/metabolite transporter (DMT)-like permease
MTGSAAPRPNGLDFVLLVALAAIWGSSFLFIKLAVATIPPLTLVAARLVLAAAGLLAFLALAGHRLPRDGAYWRGFAVLAVIGNLVPFALISWGELFIDSGLAAILMATMPLATLVLAHAFTRDDRLSAPKLAGMVVGFAGVAVLVGPDVLAGLGREAVAQLAVAGAACCYAVASVYTRRSRLVELPAAVTGAGVLLCAAVLALPISLIVERPWTVAPSAASVLALVVLALLCTSAAYLILFRLLAARGATFLSLNNYMVPVFGVVWGALFLAEAVALDALVALGLILAGIGLSQWPRRRFVLQETDPRE